MKQCMDSDNLHRRLKKIIGHLDSQRSHAGNAQDAGA